MKEFQVTKINGEACFDRPSFEDELNKHERSKVTIEAWSDAKERTLKQTAWWKGILLKQLAKETGDSDAHWEAMLKFNVMPDDFTPEVIEIKGILYTFIPSITKLSCKKMNELIEGSVDWLRTQGFMWITLPTKEK
jgi:hypothetical protein